MTEENQWTLREIREAYGEILKAYDALFPLVPVMKAHADEMNALGSEEEAFCLDAFRKKVTGVFPRLKEAADKSGNAVIWQRDQPLDGLSQSLRDRIEKALELGI